MSSNNTMKYTRFGNTGLKVSKIAFGCMSFGSSKFEPWMKEPEEGKKLLNEAYKQGINFFDTADVYSNGESERVLGEWIQENNINREDIVIATKVFFHVDKSGKQVNTWMNPGYGSLTARGLSRKHIMHAVDDSLKRLNTDYIDLYIIHRWDKDTPIEETMEALHDVVKSGKVRYIGASTMYAWQFAKAQRIAKERGWTPFVSMQNLYNLLYREEEREMIPLCNDLGVTLTPWSPLARGLLGKIDDPSTTSTRDQTDIAIGMFKQESTPDNTIRQRVLEISKKKNCSTAQLAIAWLLHKKDVSAPIIGATKVEQIADLAQSVNIELSDEELKYLEEPYRAKELMGGYQ